MKCNYDVAYLRYLVERAGQYTFANVQWQSTLVKTHPDRNVTHT